MHGLVTSPSWTERSFRSPGALYHPGGCPGIHAFWSVTDDGETYLRATMGRGQSPNRRPKGGSGTASWSIPNSKVATNSVPGSDENGGSSEAPAPANIVSG